jgi:hypothetical protein
MKRSAIAALGEMRIRTADVTGATASMSGATGITTAEATIMTAIATGEKVIVATGMIEITIVTTDGTGTGSGIVGGVGEIHITTAGGIGRETTIEIAVMVAMMIAIASGVDRMTFAATGVIGATTETMAAGPGITIGIAMTTTIVADGAAVTPPEVLGQIS